MKTLIGLWLAFSFLGLTSCTKGPETMPSTMEGQKSELRQGKTVDDDDVNTVDDDDGKQGPFEKAGSEMKKGFKKVGREIKDAFD